MRPRPDLTERLHEQIVTDHLLRAAGQAPVAQLDASTRLMNILHRWGVKVVGDFGARTWAELMDVRNCGTQMLRELQIALDRLERSLPPSAEGTTAPAALSPSSGGGDYLPAPWESRPAPLDDCPEHGESADAALATVAAWVLARTRTKTLGDLIRQGLGDERWPDEVSEAIEQLGGRDLADLAGERTLAYDPAGRLSALLDALPSSTLPVLEGRWRLDPRTLEDIGAQIGLTRERVRQIAKRSSEQVEGAAEDDLVVMGAVERIRVRLGAVTHLERAERIVADEAPRLADETPTRRRILVFLLLELAGPYGLWRRDWLTTGAGQEDLEELAAQLRQHPPLDVQDATEVVRGMGIAEAAWALVEELGFEEFAGKVVPKNLRIAERARVLMEVEARPLDPEEVAAALGAEDRVKSIRNALIYADDIVRVDRAKFAPAEWGLESYSTVTDAIGRALEERGGEGDVEEIADEISSRFSVKHSSVVAYAKSPEFVQAEGGRIRLRAPGEAVEDDQTKRALRSVPGCVLIDGRWAYRVPLKENHLRGFSPSVPHEFAAHLGAGPLTSIEVPTSGAGPISVVRSSLFANIGRLRTIAESLGLAAGDQLFIVSPAEPDGGVDFRALRRERLEGLSASDRLAMLYGFDPPFDLGSLAAAVELERAATVPEVAARLRARRENEAAEVIEDNLPSTGQEVGADEATADDLAELLGL